eukprot:6214598-Pleurochrysis_carterae.AAC.2
MLHAEKHGENLTEHVFLGGTQQSSPKVRTYLLTGSPKLSYRQENRDFWITDNFGERLLHVADCTA